MHIAAVGRALPDRYYDQETLTAALRDVWGARLRNPGRFERIHQNVRVEGRHLALDIGAYSELRSFRDSNDAWIREAVVLGERALGDALERAGLEPRDVDHLYFTTVTGLAVPSIDAMLMNRMGMRDDVKRTPLFGLGCAGGAVGITRISDALRAYPGQVAVLLSVELCSLTLQRSDPSAANLIATGLFGDGAAAVVAIGEERQLAARGPRVVDTRSILHPGTEHAMGWEIGDEGLRVVLSAEVPKLAGQLRPAVEAFLGRNGVALCDIGRFVCHPGGPRVLEALEQALDLDPSDTAVTWESLRRIGNLSSASVLFVLADTLEKAPETGTLGLMLAMGPGFSTELILLEW